MRNYIEDGIHIDAVEMIQQCFPTLLFTHPANQGRSPQQGAKLKKMGVRAGVADLIFWWAGGFGGIEIKKPKGTQSPTQKLFQFLFTRIGGKHAVCYSVPGIYATLVEWGHVPVAPCPRPIIHGTKQDKINAVINLYKPR